ncbi:NAD-dependent epimerase/dehydratase family protein [Acetonema longum]|uniref:NAD-dependent epimerase/dehydratase n=1 Tax=Acetonema longum DSM 6540 TaxID=1009370 RepID=F7NIQ1_9FIRM|nr:NAD-dependent epimerase/dehydratase family protein [Acetonema longum]EGO64115.1 NAD-dependent epimerase/dehydratase [Acetonema longum DSM 6540]
MDKLLNEHCQVTVVDNFDPYYEQTIKERNIRKHLNNSGYKLLRLDICNCKALYENLNESYDVIVHLAAKAGVRPSILDPVGYQKVNVQGTQNLLEFAKDKKIPQFVFASSSSVYGVNPNVPWRERDPVLLPISPYAATKVSGELLGHVYSQLHGIRFLSLRFFTVYGPRQRPDLAIHKFTRLISQGKEVPFYGDGSSSRDYTYIDDIIKGISAAITYDQSQYEIVNLGNSRTITLRELMTIIEEELNLKANLKLMPPQTGDVFQTFADLEKAGKLLNYQPTINIRDGVKSFIQWFHADQFSIAKAGDNT